MVIDLSDKTQHARKLASRMRRAQAATRQQAMAVDRGAFRVKSEEGLEVGTAEDPTGSEVVYGILRIIGQLIGSGSMDWTGDIEILGGGQLKIGGVIITPQGGGRIEIGVGSRQIVIDSATQRITIGTGDEKIVLDPDEFRVGPAFRMDPEHSATGAQLEFGVEGKSTIYGSDAEGVQIVALAGERPRNLTVDGNGYRMLEIPRLPVGMSSNYLVVGDQDYLYWVASGGGGGNPGTPGEPGDNPAGYIYPVNPDAWTLGDDFAAHVARGSLEPGIDWWTSVGTPIWAPGDGTIVDLSTSNASAMGRYVTLVTDAGDWFRFLHNSSIAVSVGDTVTQGQVLAYSGGSGRGSDSGYGPHTHVSFKQGYTGIFPGGSALDDFRAYMLAA